MRRGGWPGGNDARRKRREEAVGLKRKRQAGRTRDVLVRVGSPAFA